MSVQALAWVIDRSKHGGSSLVVLMMIANELDTNGIGSPSVSTIAALSRMGERSVRRIIHEQLELSGELIVRRWTNPDSVAGRSKHSYEIPGVIQDGYHYRGIPGKRSEELKGYLQPANMAGSPTGQHGRKPNRPKEGGQPATAVAGSSLYPLSRNTKNTLPNPLTSAKSASREGEKSEEVFVELSGATVRITKPQNRRLWTSREKESLVGSQPQEYAHFFHSKGFIAVVEPKELRQQKRDARRDLYDDIRREWETGRAAGTIPPHVGISEYRQQRLSEIGVVNSPEMEAPESVGVSA